MGIIKRLFDFRLCAKPVLSLYLQLIYWYYDTPSFLCSISIRSEGRCFRASDMGVFVLTYYIYVYIYIYIYIMSTKCTLQGTDLISLIIKCFCIHWYMANHGIRLYIWLYFCSCDWKHIWKRRSCAKFNEICYVFPLLMQTQRVTFIHKAKLANQSKTALSRLKLFHIPRLLYSLNR